MSQELSQLPGEVLQRLDALAAKVGTSIELLWPALVRYEYGSALGQMIGCLILPIAFFVMLRFFFAALSKVAMSSPVKCSFAQGYTSLGGETKKEWEEPARAVDRPQVVILAIVIAALGVTTIVIAMNSGPVIATLISPEAAALRSILGK